MKYSAIAVALFGASVVSALEPIVVENTSAAATSRILSFTLSPNSSRTLAPAVASQSTGSAQPSPQHNGGESVGNLNAEHHFKLPFNGLDTVQIVRQGLGRREKEHAGREEEGNKHGEKEGAKGRGKHGGEAGHHGKAGTAHFVQGADSPQATGAGGLHERTVGRYDRRKGKEQHGAEAGQHFVTGGGAVQAGGAHAARPTGVAGGKGHHGGEHKESGKHREKEEKHGKQDEEKDGKRSEGKESGKHGEKKEGKHGEEKESKHGEKKESKHGEAKHESKHGEAKRHFPTVRIGVPISMPTGIIAGGRIANGTNTTSHGRHDSNKHDLESIAEPQDRISEMLPLFGLKEPLALARRGQETVAPSQKPEDDKASGENGEQAAGALAKAEPPRSGRFHGTKGKFGGSHGKQNRPVAMGEAAAEANEGAPQASNVPQVTAKPRVRRAAGGAHPDAPFLKTAHDSLPMTTLLRLPLVE